MLLRLRPASSGRLILRPATRKEYRPARIATTGDESVCCENSIDHQAVNLLAGQGQQAAPFSSTHEAIYDLYYPEWKLPMRCRAL